MLLSKYLRELSANYIAMEDRNFEFFSRLAQDLKAAAEAGYTHLEFYCDANVSEDDLIRWAALQGLDFSRGLYYRLDWSVSA